MCATSGVCVVCHCDPRRVNVPDLAHRSCVPDVWYVWVRRKPSRLLGILCIQDDQPFTRCIPVVMSTSYTLSYASAYYSVYGGVIELLLT